MHATDTLHNNLHNNLHNKKPRKNRVLPVLLTPGCITTCITKRLATGLPAKF